MRIAHIAPPWIAIPPKNYGGSENVIYNLVEAQVAQGHGVTLFAPGDAKTSAELVSFFPYSLLAAGESWQAHLKVYYHYHSAVEYIRQHKFDIIHTHLSSSADLYLFPLLADLDIAHVTTLHSPFPFDKNAGRKLGPADEYYKQWLSSVPMVAISESAKAQAPDDLNFVAVVHHGLPMKDFHSTRKRLGNYVAWLGRFSPEKGAHLAIEAAKQAGMPIVLAGTQDRYNQESMHYYREVLEPLFKEEHVKYIGPANLQRKLNMLSRARAFLNPIEWEEPFGMVMIEAMAVGCPVISFPRGAAPEIVVDGKTGFLVKDVPEMVQALEKINEIDRAETRHHVEECFSSDLMARNYTRVYKQVITARKPAKVAVQR
jgi:glycosyltransferase involved in cell wall biosynthesis